jgi:hypothetical protein
MGGTDMQDNDFRLGLEQLFATNLTASPDFRTWFLVRTKFCRLWPLARLLRDEQAMYRGDAPWWGNWRGDGARATDMLFLFEATPTRLRFALHVEIATAASDLAGCENGACRIAALSLMNREDFFDYADFETILLAPQSLILEDARASNFDRRVPFEALRAHIPNFGCERESVFRGV